MRTYTVVLVREQDGRYSVHVPAIRGCHTQGDTVAEALYMAEDAVLGMLAVMEEDGEPAPPDVSEVTLDTAEAAEVLVYKLPIREEVALAA